MRNCVRQIIGGSDAVLSACDNISEAGACDKCPLRSTCIEDHSFADVATSFTKYDWDEFFGLSDDVSSYVDERDYIASMADMQRKETAYSY